MDRRMTAWVDAHPLAGAIMAGLVGGLVAFLLLWLFLREQGDALFGAAVAALGTGLGTYFTAFFRRQDREWQERRQGRH
jgi:ABC-type uncharacterized transport system permease subunit